MSANRILSKTEWEVSLAAVWNAATTSLPRPRLSYSSYFHKWFCSEPDKPCAPMGEGATPVDAYWSWVAEMLAARD